MSLDRIGTSNRYVLDPITPFPGCQAVAAYCPLARQIREARNPMTDVVDRETRSRLMSAIRGQNTKPELAVRRALHAAGLRYRLHESSLPGRPDIVFPSRRLAIFVHGCFWHRHPQCRFATTPATRSEFWANKFRQNAERDARAESELAATGWTVRIAWECQTKDRSFLESLARDIKATPLRTSSRRNRLCREAQESAG
jgi:DNA mismatch endonuclease (patch repair protein)